jgi:hypothetical protein
VYVGAAEPGGADTHDDIKRTFYLGLLYLLDLEALRWDALVVVVQPRCLHGVSPFLASLGASLIHLS